MSICSCAALESRRPFFRINPRRVLHESFAVFRKAGHGERVHKCRGSRDAELRVLTGARQRQRKRHLQFQFANAVDDERVAAVAHDDLRVRRFDARDLRLRAEQRNDVPIIRKTLRLEFGCDVGALRHPRHLIPGGQQRCRNGRLRLFVAVRGMRRLPQRFQFRVGNVDAGVAEFRQRRLLRRESARADGKADEEVSCEFEHGRSIAQPCEALMK